MTARYLKLKPDNKFTVKYDMKNFEIEYINLYSQKKEMEIHVIINHYDANKELKELRQLIHKNFGNDLTLKIKIGVKPEIIEKDVTEFIRFIIENYKSESVRHQYIFANYEVESFENEVFIKLPSEYMIEEGRKIEILKELSDRIFDITNKKFNIEFTNGDFEEIQEKIKEKKKHLERDVKAEEVPKIEIKKDETKDQQNGNKVTTAYNGFRRKVENRETSEFSILENLNLGEGIALEGQIFDINISETKNGNLKYEFLITDYTDSIRCVIFPKNNETLKISLNDWVKVNGIFEPDKFTGEFYIRTQKVDKIEPKISKRFDNAEKKRVELHAHTNMSEMSGVVSAKDLAKRAKEFGHSAVAVTDFGVVHSFPFAYKESDENFKIIFGVEAYVVDDEQEMITKPADRLIEDEIYVVFDIETTGLDPYKDKIIEIGAIKLKGKEIIDEFSVFINPEIDIPEEITALTNITNDMVKDAEKVETVLPKFLEFCKDTTVVAHNAKFDVGFINQKAKNLGLEYSPSVIDTLHWARILLPEQKRFGLKYIANYFNVVLDNHHRAVDDAKATAEIFQKFLNMVLSRGVLKLSEINQELQTNIQNADTLNTMILVKNQDGLRDLYELISRSHIEFFGNKKPRIPKTLLNSMRKNLLLASSASAVFGNSGELVNLYLRGTEREEIEEKAKFYDYIEIQPLSNYADLERDSLIESENAKIVLEMNRYFYDLGKKLDKIVVATGDVHYLEEREAINRSVLVLGSGMGRRVFSYDKKLFFKTTEEMLEEFSYLGNDEAYEVVVENTNKINDMIESVRPIPKGFYPPKIEGAEDEVRKMTYEKLHELYGENVPEHLNERIEKELNSIIGNGFAVLYLIAQKLVKKSLDNGYLVGSRGSVGSSIVAYMMGITEVNGLYPHYRCPNCKHSEFTELEGSGVDLEDKICPNCGTKYIKDGHAIPFEVFMGFNGDKVPDIDLNFSGEYQGEIHKYTEELFGSDNVFRAGTISTLAEKNAFGYVKKYFEEVEGTTEISKRKSEIMRIAKGCEGARKTTGQHPGGMIVVPKDKSIYDFCPIQRPANDVNADSKTTHFDYHVMDEQLVKLDLLGHDDPTTLRILQDLTGIDIYTIPLDDKKVMSLFSGTEALGATPEQIGSPVGSSGIPEFGTSFVKQMLVDTKPTTFAELVRISGLSHGTDVWLNNAQEYVRNGTATLSEIITVRDDIMNYLIDNGLDKSVAFTIMEFVRKGQPTKNPEKWKEYSKIMKEHKVKQWYIDSCEKIKYMFPKGHAVAYVMMAVRIAYFKVHYPLEFYTAFLNRKVEDFKMTAMFKPIDELKKSRTELDRKGNLNAKEKQELFLYEILIEMHYRGIELMQIDIYKSDARQFRIENGKIRMPLIAMDGLGEAVAINVINERKNGEFLSIEDLVKRTKLNKTVVDLLKTYNCVPELSATNQQTLF
ncbi:PolC-type DNA polymerase III [Pseudoleptotrichia goodfellowii]|uniref:DNA polymerase III PolC-type n=1 Tax=Pseudoleptotrichia goodfellowii F0264 TaxID=596323 RepID=D0GJV4_9FUSO|nr:PolC-type DNA polymerase III [Pseudoleptotrichia goodfellowii]EEY35648.1 DNA polymerase III, alpha subunit, Gram-positive type [Pseudoleptotrichia goodfellowii F0264]